MYISDMFTGLILFDSGATYSFISARFMSEHKIPSSLLEEIIYVEKPLESKSAQLIFNSCPIEIGGWKFKANLIVLEMQEFDVILGMDWLHQNKATIDCHEKSVTLRLFGQTKIVYHSNRRSLFRTFAMLESKEINIDEILVVNEFPDVYQGYHRTGKLSLRSKQSQSIRHPVGCHPWS
jgi:hypothetical protein